MKDIAGEALVFAAKAHDGMRRRKSDAPYILHPMEVGAIIGTMTDDQEVIAAGLLHDVVEDAGISIEEIGEKFGERVMVKCADEIIVLSESAREYFKNTYNRETVLIHNGIEKPEKKEADKITELYGLSAGGYICIVSRLTAEKGVHYLIDSYNSIKTDKKLVIAGDTSDTDEYVAMIKEKAACNPNIIFTGFITGDVLREIYSNAYLVTLPSDIEGMSLSLLEALAYGNAVLCSDIPENTLVTEDRAMHFRKSDTDDLAAKLQMMCDDESIVCKLKSG
ncbi:MAG: glycosyltransferase, partial [Clostridia bacterium]|nr:glycosyltransferase [Clostridia bacterium]